MAVDPVVIAALLMLFPIIGFVFAVLADPWSAWVKRAYYAAAGLFGILIGALMVALGAASGRGGGKIIPEPAWYEAIPMALGFWGLQALIATIPGCVFVVVGAMFVWTAIRRKEIVDYGTKALVVKDHSSSIR